MYRVFLSHNTSRDEMVIAWRLQTLAGASGIQLDVPTSEHRRNWKDIALRIDCSQCVIGFYTISPAKQVLHEVQYAQRRGKTVVLIADKGLRFAGKSEFINGIKVFYIDPLDPGAVSKEVSGFLAKEKVKKDAKGAILALAGTLLGLYLLEEASTR